MDETKLICISKLADEFHGSIDFFGMVAHFMCLCTLSILDLCASFIYCGSFELFYALNK